MTASGRTAAQRLPGDVRDLRAERAVLAELLLSLAEFKERSLYRDLGYATFFDYLHRELGPSRGMSHYRQVAVRLVQRYPEVVEPIRDGRLCLTTVIELARVITQENCAEVLPSSSTVPARRRSRSPWRSLRGRWLQPGPSSPSIGLLPVQPLNSG